MGVNWTYDNVKKCYVFQEGGIIKAETGWHVYINPRNWGVSRDYEKGENGKMRTFNQAYKAARDNGEKEFLYNNKRYNTTYQHVPIPPQKRELKTALSARQKALADDVWNYLHEKGVHHKNIAAIMGNIMQESSFMRNVVQKGGDNAEGLFQMHGQDLNAYNKWKQSNSAGKYPELDYILYVIESKDHPYSNEYKRVSSDPSKKDYVERVYGNRMRNNTLYLIDDLNSAWKDKTISLDSITDLFTNTIERAGKPEYVKRRQYATDFYNHYHGEQQ